MLHFYHVDKCPKIQSTMRFAIIEKEEKSEAKIGRRSAEFILMFFCAKSGECAICLVHSLFAYFREVQEKISSGCQVQWLRLRNRSAEYVFARISFSRIDRHHCLSSLNLYVINNYLFIITISTNSYYSLSYY